MKKNILYFLFVFLIFQHNRIVGNNVIVGTPSVSGNNITFTIQWDNSWNLATIPNNWDAVWVFVKYENCSNSLWTHANLSTVSGNHSVTGGVLQVDAVSDGKGVFIRRSTYGSGNIASSTVTLQMAFTDAGYNYQVFATEMVNIPQGDFYIGDGGHINGGSDFCNSATWGALPITNAIQNTTGIAAATYNQYSSYGLTLTTTFPMGWNSFYCMKYEVSQAQYTAFLNTLTFDQQYFRTVSNPGSAVGTQALGALANRNGIRLYTQGTNNIIPAVYICDLNANNTPNDANDGQDIACNFLKWDDLAAYLDWAALRPMTEMEFEKISRGAGLPTVAEPPWGSVLYTQATSTSLTGAGTSSEASTASGNGLCAYGGGAGPLRCGFAATGSTSRIQSGGSYYGAMEMAGNLMETVITLLGYSNSANFTTLCGDGTLTSLGDANTLNWPPYNGVGCRGGSYDKANTYTQTSDRSWANLNISTRYSYVGGRGVR